MKKDIRFDKRATKYDNGIEGFLSQRFYNDLLDNVILSPGNCVLDVGCGTGTFLNRLSNNGTKISCYGIDYSKNMIWEAEKKYPQMNFCVGNSKELPYEDATMDVVITCMAYHHFEDQKAFRKEAFRILKPCGELYVCDPKFPAFLSYVFNSVFRLSKTAARFYNKDEYILDFTLEGFTFHKYFEDSYVQIINFKK